MSKHALASGRSAGNRLTDENPAPPPAHARKSHADNATMPVQRKKFVAPHFGFQPLPTPSGDPPFRFDLSQLLHPDDVARIAAGKLVFHCTGDTGDERGRAMDFVAAMMTLDYDASPAGEAPAFFYHLGDVVYFAGDIDGYGENFYETYDEYPGLIVAIPGNHDCQPDDPQDGPIDPNKKPLDGWVQNFMSKTPSQLGSLKTNSQRTQMDLPNVYWTFATPLATVIGLFSNVSETEAEVHQDQIDWFKGELAAAPKDKALIVTIHHPPFSGDVSHSGSSAAERILFGAFQDTNVYPHLILSGHVHNYQRFTVKEAVGDIACVVCGNGGYTKLGKLHKVDGQFPTAPLTLTDTLTLDSYDQDHFGFLRVAVTKTQIDVSYLGETYVVNTTPPGKEMDSFTIDLATRKVT